MLVAIHPSFHPHLVFSGEAAAMEELPQSETGLSAAALDRISLSLSEAELNEIAFDGEAAERVPAFYFQNLWTVTGGEPPDASRQGISPELLPRELQAALETLKKVVVTADSTDGGGDRCCPICLEELEVGGEARMMGCSHRYHENCIFEWLKRKSTCPLCRHQPPAG